MLLANTRNSSILSTKKYLNGGRYNNVLNCNLKKL